MMREERRVKDPTTPGEDPREIDRERTSSEWLARISDEGAMVHTQRAKYGLGTSSDSPGRDIPDLEKAHAPEVRDNRHQS